MTVYGFRPKQSSKVAVIPIGKPTARKDSLDLSRFSQFWDLMDTVQIHGYVSSAMSVIGRSTIGAWWDIVRDDDATNAPDRQRKRLKQFYQNPFKTWDNVKDFMTFAYKLMIGAMYLRYFGQTAFQILRNTEGQRIGLDHLPGYVVPNVDADGKFRSPAFYQYPTKNPAVRVEFDNPNDIVYIINPNWQGYATGGSDMEALTDFALPIDIYLQTTAREYLKNRDKPEAFYILPADVSDEAFDAFTQAIEAKYAGPNNVGRSPITVAGELDIKELKSMPGDLPYQDARKGTREEILATSGVAGAKLGLTDSLSSANLREARREFHESTMIPLFRMIEEAFYEQVHIREFGITAWRFQFNNPDFLNAVERATVHMRYKQMSALTPNEIRREIGKPGRKDEMGDKFDDELAEEKADQKAENQPGSPPEGRPIEPDAPSQTGEPTLDNQDPPRGDQHDENATDRQNNALMDELRTWKLFAIKRAKKGKAIRPFVSDVIPEYLRDAIQDRLNCCTTTSDVGAVFTEVSILLEEEVSE